MNAPWVASSSKRVCFDLPGGVQRVSAPPSEDEDETLLFFFFFNDTSPNNFDVDVSFLRHLSVWSFLHASAWNRLLAGKQEIHLEEVSQLLHEVMGDTQVGSG